MPTFVRPRLRLVGITVAAAVILATTACQAEPESTPADAATAYLEALSDGDAAAVNALTAENDVLPADDSLDGVQSIGSFEVGAVPEDYSESVDVPVTYSLANEPHEATLSLDLIDDVWQVTGGLDGKTQLTWDGYADSTGPWSTLPEVEVKIGSTVVGDYTVDSLLYPGRYDVTTDLGKYGEISTPAVTVVPHEDRSGTTLVEVGVAPTTELFDESEESLAAGLAEILERDDVWSDLYADDAGLGPWAYVRDDLEGATIEWDVFTPVEVSWLDGMGMQIDATATIHATWTKGSEEGEIYVPLTAHTFAVPTLDSLDVWQPLWYYAD